jgi:hypothetical protein
MDAAEQWLQKMEALPALPNEEDAFLRIVKQEHLPVVIFGMGECSVFVKDFLIQNGITDFVYAVDASQLSCNAGAISCAEADRSFPQYALMPAIGCLPKDWRSRFPNAVRSLYIYGRLVSQDRCV